MCFVITAGDAPRVVKALRGTLELELTRGHVEEISAQPVAVVAAIGDRMRGTPGIAATVFGALGSEGINVIAIARFVRAKYLPGRGGARCRPGDSGPASRVSSRPRSGGCQVTRNARS